MILELGACYETVIEYGVVNEDAETDHSVRLLEKSMFLVLEFMGIIGEYAQYEHYKVLFEDKIIYIIVWSGNTILDQYIRKIT